ncbi:Pro-apoptotic serine protease [Fonsecaea nubica]|uniref:Pro-apoptotic serine protease n=1 Tax=Fonsecaea nubica TaxID=856822 RepID=A0A178CV30_9EURO|nr:Pro-apoptotic serine protease [Fonsecaea nubica]OAL32775.1 Pro-apoptotic serine protease [Fonsecaea nubica]
MAESPAQTGEKTGVGNDVADDTASDQMTAQRDGSNGDRTESQPDMNKSSDAVEIGEESPTVLTEGTRPVSREMRAPFPHGYVFGPVEGGQWFTFEQICEAVDGWDMNMRDTKIEENLARMNWKSIREVQMPRGETRADTPELLRLKGAQLQIKGDTHQATKDEEPKSSKRPRKEAKDSTPTAENVSKKPKTNRSQKVTTDSTALEITMIDPSKRLGIFRDGEMAKLELAGLEMPVDNAPAKEKRKFKAAIVSAVGATEKMYPEETWYKPWTWALEVYAGVRQSKDVGDISVREMMEGARLTLPQIDEERGREDEVAGDSTASIQGLGGSETNKMSTASKYLLRNIGYAVTQRKLKTFNPDGTSKTKKKISDAERYPKLSRDHPNWKKAFTKEQIEEIINTYRSDKQERHKNAPAYFDNRGFLRLSKELNNTIIEEWVEKAQPLLRVRQEWLQTCDENSSEDRGEPQWPDDLWPEKVVRGLLANATNTLGRLHSQGLLNAKGNYREAPLKKVGNLHDASGRFVRTSDLPGGLRPVNKLGTNECIAMVLGQHIDENAKGDPKQRLDIARSTFNKAVLSFAEDKVRIDESIQAVLKSIKEKARDDAEELRESTPSDDSGQDSTHLWFNRLASMEMLDNEVDRYVRQLEVANKGYHNLYIQVLASARSLWRETHPMEDFMESARELENEDPREAKGREPEEMIRLRAKELQDIEFVTGLERHDCGAIGERAYCQPCLSFRGSDHLLAKDFDTKVQMNSHDYMLDDPENWEESSGWDSSESEADANNVFVDKKEADDLLRDMATEEETTMTTRLRPRKSSMLKNVIQCALGVVERASVPEELINMQLDVARDIHDREDS